VQHIFKRAGQAIEFPDDDCIPLAQLVEHAVLLGPVPASTRAGFLEDAAAAGGSEGFRLQPVALSSPLENAGIAE
jgi:hypothetical protein